MSRAAYILACSLRSDQNGVPLGALWVPEQHEDAAAVLDPGPHAPRQHWLGRPKGASKTSDVSAFVLAWLVEDSGPLDEAFVIGADEDQGNRLLNRARGFVRRSALGSVVKVEAKGLTNVRNGARVNALAADVAGGEGILSPLIVCEEVPNWAQTESARGMWTVAFSSIPKWHGTRFVVIGHAGSPAHWSYRVLEHARSSSAWRVRELPGPCAWWSPVAVDEQRALLLPSEFERRALNRWVESEDALTTLEDVVACVGHEGELKPRRGYRYVCALDVGITNDRCVAVVAHGERRDGGWTVVVDRVAVWAGSRARPVVLSDVEAWVSEACRDYRAGLVFDPYQSVQLSQNVKRRGVRVQPFVFSQANVGRLAVTLYRLLRDRRLDLPEDRDLVNELASVRLVERSPGMYRIDHVAGRHDDRVVTLAMAAATLAEKGASVPASCWTAAGRSIPVMSAGPAATLRYLSGGSSSIGRDDWRLRHAWMALGMRGPNSDECA